MEEENPAVEVASREAEASIRRAVGFLPSRLRDLVRMRYLERLSPAAIAEEGGLSESNVRIRLYRALRLLRKRLGDAP